ncbi:mandelate racemase/muconate lactonizing enzyme family protein [Chelatococcus asaccharovorans]|uniref:mandelate racemase/muconate lactonizing enzyme family protein n=1 Tax=Chelatococcus asaccharovorans TaxID=28210 RepID=UPI00224C7329|nr:mandelate racemase/muconate lactonizing enzyme family protein [Chelatococcus asaccharovorans]CAH1657669.1 Gluconate dehydratase [Chelatococcus asaccharovorans]CAH1684725.1 Gluconate dehydratase [Chelatococcus asaccharovorans]
MKITAVKTYLMQVGSRPTTTSASQGGAAQDGAGRDSAGLGADADFRGSRNWLFVKIFTDEGITGVGECSGWPRVIETAVKDYASILVGEEAGDIDRLWHRLYVASMGHGILGTVGGGALTGIEMALWDIKGKALGQPVWNLLGGRFRDRIRVYGHAKTPERARDLMARGYTGVKVGFTGAVDIDCVAAVREAVGPDVDVMVDAHGPSWMTPQDAIIVGRAMEPLDLLFYEDPVAPESLDALARVRDAVDIPLAAGERVSTIWGIRPYIERDLVDVIQPDTGRAGGITQMRKMAAMAEGHFITMAPHSGSLGPVAEFAALHVMATIPNALMLERVEFDWPGRYEVVEPVLKVVDGHLPVPTAPGLGVDIVEEEVARYPSRRNVADMPPEDGWAYETGTVGENVYFQTRLKRRAKLRRTDG